MRVFRLLALAGALVAASSANAYIVTEWNYVVTSQFSGPIVYNTGSGPVSTNPGDTGPTAPTPPQASFNPGALWPIYQNSANGLSLAWGLPDTSNGQSSLVISGNPASSPPATPLFTTIGAGPPSIALDQIAFTQTFTHNNFPVYIENAGGASLKSAEVTTTLTLDPFVPDDPAFPTFPPLTFHIDFAETPNAGSNGVCAGGITPIPAAGCPDIFVISGGLNNFPFDYAGQHYIVSIFPNPATPLQTLTAAECQAAGFNGSPCFGFITQENQANAVQFGFAITTEPISIPEPGMLTLFGLGLLALGYSLRRRQS